MKNFVELSEKELMQVEGGCGVCMPQVPCMPTIKVAAGSTQLSTAYFASSQCSSIITGGNGVSSYFAASSGPCSNPSGSGSVCITSTPYGTSASSYVSSKT